MDDNANTIMVGINPVTGETCQLIGVEYMEAPEGVAVHRADDGGLYWCRPFRYENVKRLDGKPLTPGPDGLIGGDPVTPAVWRNGVRTGG